MSKLYQKYLKLKRNNTSTIYIFKSGIFYIFLDDDAKKISPILNLKLSNLNENILKCVFPVNSFQKYIDILKNSNIDFEIIEKISNKADCNSQNNTIVKENYSDNYNFKMFLEKIANIDIDNLSIRETYSLLENLSKEAKLILNKL